MHYGRHHLRAKTQVIFRQNSSIIRRILLRQNAITKYLIIECTLGLGYARQNDYAVVAVAAGCVCLGGWGFGRVKTLSFWVWRFVTTKTRVGFGIGRFEVRGSALSDSFMSTT
jgi:hypothetical protein